MPGKYPVDYFGSFAKGYKFGEGRREIKRKGDLEERQMSNREGLLNVSEGHLKLAEEKQTSDLQKIPVPKRQVTEREFAEIEGKMGAIDKQLKTKLVNTIKPVLNIMKDIKVRGGNKLDTYRVLKQDWPAHVKPAQEGLKKMIAEAIANNDTEAVGKYGEMLDEISSEDFLDKKLFPVCARYEADLQAGGKPAKIYGEPYVGPGGSLLQKEKQSGKVGSVLGRKPPGKSGGMSEKDKRLKNLRDNYFRQITQARSAAKGIDPIMKDIEVDIKAVREDANKKAQILADEYVKAGGRLEDLGLEKPKPVKKQNYKSAEAVRTAFKAGKMSEKEAEKILQKTFGYK